MLVFHGFLVILVLYMCVCIAIETIKNEILKLEKGKGPAAASAERCFSEFMARKRNEQLNMTEKYTTTSATSSNPRDQVFVCNIGLINHFI